MPQHIYRRIKESTFRSFDALVQLCIDRRADFLCIAGDVFDLADRSLRAQTYFQKGLRHLEDHGIQVYVIHGNHDPEDGGKASLIWPGNTTFFSAQQVESAPFVKDGQEVARIYGRSYPTAKFTRNIVDEYQRDPGVPFAIGLLHTNLDGDPNHDNYAPCTRLQLKENNFDYWALGHIHQPAVIEEREPAIVYAGNIQGRSVKESGPRGCYMVNVKNGEIENITFQETDDVRWYHEELDLTGTERIQHVFDRIQDQLQELADRSGNRPSIVRLELTGMTPLHTQLTPVDDFLEGLQPCIEDLVNQENWVWLESVRIRTRPEVSREELLEGRGFAADFLKEIERIRSNQEELSILREEILRDLFGHRDGKKHLSPLSEDDMQQLLQEVEDMAVRLFYEDEEDAS